MTRDIDTNYGLDIPIDDDVLHVISFKGYSGKVNITGLNKYFNFNFNPVERTVSFQTEMNTNFRKSFSTDIFSKDPQIHSFNKDFLAINKQIPYNLIQTKDILKNKSSFDLTDKIILGIFGLGAFTIFLYINKK